LSSAAWVVSSTVTGIPALAKFIAIPPPMVPAPITATDLIARSGVPLGTSGILAAARIAKNACRKALDSGVLSNSTNNDPSILIPSSKGLSTAASTASMHLSGAG
jgi:hypothetical protein